MITDARYCKAVHTIIDVIVRDIEDNLTTEEFQEFCDDLVPIRETINKVEARLHKKKS